MKKIIYFYSFLFLSTLSFSQTYPRGILKGIDEGYKQIPQKASLTRNWYVGTPSYFSLKKYAPTPGHQGQYGTCTGWAVGYAARTIIEAKKQGWSSKDTITQNAFSPTYQYRQASDSYNCNGAFTSQVVQSLKTIGSIPKKEFYVTGGTALCPATPLHYSNDDKAKQYKIEEYTTLWGEQFGYNYSKISKVKASVSEGNPVVISMICPDSFDKVGSLGLWQPTENPNDNTSNRQHGRHALCVVGYDNSKFGGAFEIQNSWGTVWGNNGYGWIKYEDFANFVYQAYEIIVEFPQLKPKEPYLSGSLRLYNLNDQENLEVTLAEKTRNWNVVGPKKGGKHTYKVVSDLLSGSEMRMYLKSEQPAYVYLLGTGTVDKTVLTLFPVDGISPAMNYNNYEVALPSEDHYFKMDNTVGKNYIIVIYSKEKLDIENIRGKVANGYGSISQKVDNALSNLITDSKYIKFNDSEIKFEVAQNSSNKKAFAMIIEFNQVN